MGRLVALCVVLSACWGPPELLDDVYCEGEEVDFSPLGDLSGRWIMHGEDDDMSIVFDDDSRIRSLRGREFGCEPTQRPLVLGGVTIRDNYPSPADILELQKVVMTTSSVTLFYQRGGKGALMIVYKIEVVDDDHLRYFYTSGGPASNPQFNHPPSEYVRASPNEVQGLGIIGPEADAETVGE